MATERRQAKKLTKRRAPGRPTKLVPSITRKILDELEDGATLEAACAGAGISTRTVRAWLAQGASSAATPAQRDFAGAVAKAQAVAESEALKDVRNGKNVAGEKDWRASLEWLRVTRPEKYGTKALNDAKVRGAVNEILSAVINRISVEAAGEFLNALELEYRLRGLLQDDEVSSSSPRALTKGA